MVRNVHVITKVDGGEGVVIKGRIKVGRADRQKGDIGSPNVSEGGFDVVEPVSTRENVVGKCPAIEGNDGLGY